MGHSSSPPSKEIQLTSASPQDTVTSSSGTTPSGKQSIDAIRLNTSISVSNHSSIQDGDGNDDDTVYVVTLSHIFLFGFVGIFGLFTFVVGVVLEVLYASGLH